MDIDVPCAVAYLSRRDEAPNRAGLYRRVVSRRRRVGTRVVKAKYRTSWQRALTLHFDAGEQLAIERSALEFAGQARGRHIVAGLQAERFLGSDEMRVIQDFLLHADWLNYDVTTKAYGRLCYGLVLRGGKIRGRTPQMLGRAVEPAAFAKTVCDANRGRPRLRAVSALLSRVADGTANNVDQDALSRLQMAEFASWVTWDADSRGRAPPFSFSTPLCADEIRGSLGLSQIGIGKPIYLMNFASSDAPKPITRPTCADAGLHLRFEPPPLGELAFGWTKPWEEVPGHKDPPAFPSRPEALLKGPMLFPASMVLSRHLSRMSRRRP